MSSVPGHGGWAMVLSRDHYRILQVGRDASREQIQRAYHRLARRFHPDMTPDPGAHDQFRDVSEAYRVLSDPASRSRYDRSTPDGYGWQRRREDRPRNESAPGRSVKVPVYRPSGDPRGVDGGWASWPARGLGTGGMPRPVVQVPVDVSPREAYAGTRRLICLSTAAGVVALEVTLPPGVYSGQRLRLIDMRATDSYGRPMEVDLVIRTTSGLSRSWF